MKEHRPINVSRERFDELYMEKKIGKVTRGSIDKALAILEAEGQGLIKIRFDLNQMMWMQDSKLPIMESRM